MARPVPSALPGREFEHFPGRTPDPLARNTVAQRLGDRAPAERGQHRLLGPHLGISGAQMGVQSLPQLGLSHPATLGEPLGSTQSPPNVAQTGSNSGGWCPSVAAQWLP